MDPGPGPDGGVDGAALLPDSAAGVGGGLVGGGFSEGSASGIFALLGRGATTSRRFAEAQGRSKGVMRQRSGCGGPGVRG
ncbi:hypothetical protein Sm713_11570 [Streptomyces sp. TS71-3]|nr:hypothetical protein Sm713_11570 [Streptomyces sp. TS71-3]